MTKQETQSKEFRRPMPAVWWLKKKSYALFMLRELTCVFVGGYALLLLFLAAQVGNGREAEFASLLNSPVLIVLQIIALPMALYHTVTWLNLTPKVLVVWRGEERVSPYLIAGVHYLAWGAVSLVILWVVSLYR